LDHFGPIGPYNKNKGQEGNMQSTPARQQRPERHPQAEQWSHSETLFLLTCYDVWSATPARGCECTEAVALPDQRPSQLSLQFI
jgi:hypothetical protein